VEIQIKFDTKRNLHTAQIFTLRKALDNFYYFHLLLGESSYGSDENVWLSWLKIGFETSLVERPPGVPRDDRMRIETQPEPRWVVIRIESAKSNTLTAVKTLLQRVNTLRNTFQDKSEEDRATALLNDRDASSPGSLLKRLNERLGTFSLRPAEIQQLNETIRESTLWITDNDILDISVTKTKS